jgi:hypothetical protein
MSTNKDQIDIRATVYNTVVGWLAKKLDCKPHDVRVGRSLSAPPPDGYGQIKGSFRTMCDQISATLSLTTGRALTLPTAWRIKHQNDSVTDFISAVALLLTDARVTRTGKASLAWAKEQ